MRKRILTPAMLGGALVTMAGATHAQRAAAPAAGGTAPHACTLLTSAEVERVTGRKLYGEPDTTALRGGSACTFGGGAAQVILYTGGDPEARYNALAKGYGRDREARRPVTGVGEKAYAMSTVPRNEYEDAITMIVTRVGPHVAGVSAAAADGQKGESAEPAATALAKLVVGRLR